MRRNFAFSVTDEKLILAIEKFKKEGGNLSGLIVKLLENYFFEDNNKEIITEEMMLLLEIKKRLEEFEKWKEEIIPKIQELEEQLRKQQEEKETEENLYLIRMLREVVFDEIANEGFEKWASEVKFNTPENAIKARLHKFAAEHKLTFPEAKKLFFKAFPELKEVLEGKL